LSAFRLSRWEMTLKEYVLPWHSLERTTLSAHFTLLKC
jgi:hypothetical protein